MQLYQKNKITIIELISFFLIAIIFISLLIPANRDLVNSFSLFMDERISFDGVSNILHPNGVSDFIWSITDGGDHRYGRIFWNSIAIFVFLPEYFLGEFGQIFFTRMFLESFSRLLTFSDNLSSKKIALALLSFII